MTATSKTDVITALKAALAKNPTQEVEAALHAGLKEFGAVLDDTPEGRLAVAMDVLTGDPTKLAFYDLQVSLKAVRDSADPMTKEVNATALAVVKALRDNPKATPEQVARIQDFTRNVLGLPQDDDPVEVDLKEAVADLDKAVSAQEVEEAIKKLKANESLLVASEAKVSGLSELEVP